MKNFSFLEILTLINLKLEIAMRFTQKYSGKCCCMLEWRFKTIFCHLKSNSKLYLEELRSDLIPAMKNLYPNQNVFL